MYHIKETVVVEGVYDKIKLSRFLQGIIFVTNGFCIFSRPDKMTALKNLAQKTGVVIFTDSDTAGFKIRNYIKQALPQEQVKHAYIPELHGKEKRKNKAGAEGLLGVEGVSEQVLLDALLQAGCCIDGTAQQTKPGRKLSKADFFADGFSGRTNSRALRDAFAKELGLPTKVSANMLLSVANRLLTYEEYREIIQSLQENTDIFSE